MKKAALAVLSLALVASAPAFAGTLYTNGPLDGNDIAFTLNDGFSVSNSFTLTSTSTITSVDFGAWVFSGDALTSVDWSISSAAFGGSATTSGTTGVFDFVNQYGYDVYTDTFSTGSLTLGPGTYYLTLENAVTANGSYAYWDQNNGPSIAYDSALGNLNGYDMPGNDSETFDINGTSGGPVVPEPSSLLLMGSGLVSFAGMMRRKLKA